MATAAQMFSNTDQGDSSGSDDQSSSSKQNHRSASTNNNQPRPGQHLDGLLLLYISFENILIIYEHI